MAEWLKYPKSTPPWSRHLQGNHIRSGRKTQGDIQACDGQLENSEAGFAGIDAAGKAETASD